MVDSVLDTIKTMLGIDVLDTSFDEELIVHINSTLTNLEFLGLPLVGSTVVEVKDSTTLWNEILTNPEKQGNVKSYIYLNVRLIFDPPQNSFLEKAIEDNISRLEWLINVQSETVIV